MVSINNSLIKIDQVCDFIPYVSTATNAVTLIFKATVSAGCVPKAIQKNSFAQHLCNKSKLRCVTLLVPRYGNIAFAVYKLLTVAFSKSIDLIPLLPTPQPRQLPLSLQEGLRRQKQEIKKLEAAIEASRRRDLEAEANRKAQEEIELAEFETKFINQVRPVYHQRFAHVNEECKSYLDVLRLKSNEDADEFGQSLTQQLWLLYQSFENNISYRDFNIAVVRVGQERKDKLLNAFLSETEFCQLRVDLHANRLQCIESTQSILQTMATPPKEKILSAINKKLQKLTAYQI
jgi:hypothetical protein